MTKEDVISEVQAVHARFGKIIVNTPDERELGSTELYGMSIPVRFVREATQSELVEQVNFICDLRGDYSPELKTIDYPYFYEVEALD